MKVKLCSSVAILAGLVFVGYGGAQQNNPRQAGRARFGDPTVTAQHLQNYIYGVVKKVEKGQLVLDKTEFGDDQPFKLEAKTKYIYNGKSGKPGDFKIGDQVFIQIKKDKKTGEMIAKRVEAGVTSTTP